MTTTPSTRPTRAKRNTETVSNVTELSPKGQTEPMSVITEDMPTTTVITPDTNLTAESNGAESNGFVRPLSTDELAAELSDFAPPADVPADETPSDATDAEPEEQLILSEKDGERRAGYMTQIASLELDTANQQEIVNNLASLVKSKKEAKERARFQTKLTGEEKALDKMKGDILALKTKLATLETRGKEAWDKKAKADKAKKVGTELVTTRSVALTSEQNAEKAELEGQIEVILDQTRKSASQVSSLLGIIRDKKLYPLTEKTDAKSFDKYLMERWGMDKTAKNRYLNMLDLNQHLLTQVEDPDVAGSPALSRLPETETQVRELSRAGSLDNKTRVWREVIKRNAELEEVVKHPVVIEGAFVRKVVDEIIFGKDPNASENAIEARNEAIKQEVEAGVSNETVEPILLTQYGVDALYHHAGHMFVLEERITKTLGKAYYAVIDGVRDTKVYETRKKAYQVLESFAERQADATAASTPSAPGTDGGLFDTNPLDSGTGPFWFVGDDDGKIEDFEVGDLEDYNKEHLGYPEGKLFGPFLTAEEAAAKKEELQAGDGEVTGE